LLSILSESICLPQDLPKEKTLPVETWSNEEPLDGEIFCSLAEARIVIESWRRHDNTVRPHGSLGHKPPAPEVFVPAMAARTAAQPYPSASGPPPAMASRPSMHKHSNRTNQWGLISH
jgi:hypothetical protein